MSMVKIIEIKIWTSLLCELKKLKVKSKEEVLTFILEVRYTNITRNGYKTKIRIEK